MTAKLIIDLDRCRTQAQSGVKCSYNNHPENKGIDALLEMIRFALICRRCQAAPCVNACPQQALEKVLGERHDAGILKRANMRCTGCGTCAIACPFGTIYTDLIPFPSSVCDLCRGRLNDDGKPMCAATCSDGSIEYGEIDVENAEDMVQVFDNIVVRVAGGSTWEPFFGKKEKANE